MNLEITKKLFEYLKQTKTPINKQGICDILPHPFHTMVDQCFDTTRSDIFMVSLIPTMYWLSEDEHDTFINLMISYDNFDET